jgi:putative Mg2+ transporter-C (MgtC) family protein
MTPGMSPEIGWGAIILRLTLSLVAGVVIGLDRNEHGKPAGLRTTTLVCLAATVAMIQANILLPIAGKSPTSFVTLDLMRLPLGILSGVGFLGAGAIIRRSDRVLGLTTAATLWIVTVVGLCFGGGQLGLGAVATLLAVTVLWAFKALERRIHQERQGILVLVGRNVSREAELTEFFCAEFHTRRKPSD